jgi:CRP-like cAMP-binding protein
MLRSPGSAHELLAGIPLFSGLEEPVLARLAKHAQEMHVRRGTLLFSPGERPSGLFAVVSGLVKLALPKGPDQEKVVALLRSGSTFGLAAMFLEEPYMVSAAAVRECVIAHIPAAHVLASMKRDAAFSSAIAMALSRSVRDLLVEMRSSTIESGTQRTVTFLLAELPKTARTGAATITLPAKKRIIASRLDLTGEHFSRILHELAAARLIAVDGPKVTIRDVTRLREYAARD